jgi:hypothetical protein
MLKGCFNLLVFTVILTGILYYIYEKYDDEINNYANEQLQLVYEHSLKPILNKFSSDYSDSTKAFLTKKFNELKKSNKQLGSKQLEGLKKILKEYSQKKVIDSADYSKLKKFINKLTSSE